MKGRKIENIKVFFRERPLLYKIARALYFPVRIVENRKLKRRIKKDVSELLERLERLDKKQNYVFFVGIPVCENLGDLAMMVCIRKWIEKNFAGYGLFEMKTYPTYDKKVRQKLKELVKEDDIFVTQSGAVYGDRHQDHGMHRYLLKEFPKNRILFMPGTAEFAASDELSKTANLFNTHKKALLLARDQVSFKMLSAKLDKERIRLFPDIVTCMIGRVDEPKGNNREGVLVCKRIDGEKVLTDKNMDGFIDNIRTEVNKVSMTDMMFEQSYEYVMLHATETISAKLRLFASYQVLVTDRLHGMIYALISNTPVVVLPTYNHKVREAAKWFKEYYPESVFFCETLEEAEDRTKELLQNKPVIQNKSIFKEKYYDGLKAEFDSITI